MKQFKSYSGMAAVCAMLTFASCGNDIELTEAQAPAKGEYKVTFTASQESSATRTAVDGTNVVWQTGDAITVFDGGRNNCTFELSKGAGTTLGEFQGTITVTEPKSYCAVYPAVRNAAINSDYGISGLSLPVEQVATPDGFDPMAAIMTARNDNADNITSTKEDLSLGEFKHVCAFVKVTTTEAYDKITFTANGGEGIAGGFTVTLDENGISTVTPAADASTTVSLVPAAGSAKIAAGTYLIAVLPQALSQGFTITCVKNGDANSQIVTMTRSFNNTVGETVFSRRNVVNMGTASETNGWTYFTPTYVDLGLSVKWATMNVGATSPEESGDYFAWGETSPKDDYSWAAYKWCGGTQRTLFKYNNSSDQGNVVDGKITLESEDDAATVNWGGSWRMPTIDELTELMNGCYWEWTEDYDNDNSGVKGFVVYKVKDAADKGVVKIYLDSNTTTVETYDYTKGDAHIFLSLSGCCENSSLLLTDTGQYWTATLTTDSRLANLLLLRSDHALKSKDVRRTGRLVRPVRP